MRIVCIIQARMDSSRLPGKVMEDIAGRPMLAHVVARAAAIEGVEDVIVATTGAHEDSAIVDLARSIGVGAFAGSTDDVLDRYYQAAREFKADGVVRITADCPLIDPVESARVVARFAKGDLDYATNLVPPTFPDGQDTEVVSFEALEKIWDIATLPSDREHVITYIRTNPHLFKVHNVTCDPDLSQLRLTVDEPDDLVFVRKIFSALGPEAEGEFISMHDVIGFLRDNPEIATMHPDHDRNEGWTTSIVADREPEEQL